MTIKHTPEPWQVHQDASGDVFVSSAKTSFHIAEIGSEDDEAVIPDARRIVACVNACHGLPTEELEQKGLVAAVGTQLLDVEQQRDELLSLAERLVRWDIDHPVDCDNGYAGLKALDELIRDNKAAIVKIKGEHSQQPNALLDDVYVAGGST
ncbi:hypothetical protein ACK35Y_20045 [Aeromonas veronii]